MAKTIKIVKGQPFCIWLPCALLNSSGAELIDASDLQGVEVFAKTACNAPIVPTIDKYEQYLVLSFAAIDIVATFDLHISATYHGNDKVLNMQAAFATVQWDSQSNWQDFIVGDHIQLDMQPFLTGSFVTDADYERLKEQLQQEIERVQELQEEWMAKIAEITDVAKQTTLLEGIESQAKDATVAKEVTLLAAKEEISIIHSRANSIYSEGAKQGTLLAVAQQNQQGFENTLGLLRNKDEGVEYTHSFADGLYDPYYSINGNLSTAYTMEVRGEVIFQSLKMESNTAIRFNSEAEGTLTIYAINSKTHPFNVLVDGQQLEFDGNGVASINLAAGSHSITKGTTNTFVFFVSLEIEDGGYRSKIDIAKDEILAAITDAKEEILAAIGNI